MNLLCISYFTFSKIRIDLGVIAPDAAVVASLNFVSYATVVLIAVFVAPDIVTLDDLLLLLLLLLFLSLLVSLLLLLLLLLLSL